MRRRGRHFVQTVKAAASRSENGLARGEWEDRVKSDAPDPRAAQTGPFLPPEIAARLRPLFRTEVSRLTIPLAPEPATLIEAAIDRRPDHATARHSRRADQRGRARIEERFEATALYGTSR